jgi:hypothetical protein
MDLAEVAWGDVDWNLQVPQNAGKLLSGYTIAGLSSSAPFHSWLVSYVHFKSSKYFHCHSSTEAASCFLTTSTLNNKASCVAQLYVLVQKNCHQTSCTFVKVCVSVTSY